MKVLVIGATGMLGYSLFSNLGEVDGLDVYGTVRSLNNKEKFFAQTSNKLITGVEVNDLNTVEAAIKEVQPDIVLNCIGLIKQHEIAKQNIDAITINALLPHQLARLCDQFNAKLIHFSTDCVFAGDKGQYLESDLPDAQDLYGKSKCLGEVNYAPHLTLRTSIIGHELSSSVSLIDWFLSESGSVKGFSKAKFSGLPTCVIARILAEKILPNKSLSGLYHFSVASIDKLTLLNKVKSIYQKEIEIIESQDLSIDRSLNSQRLINAVNLDIPDWDSLIEEMHRDYKKRYEV